MVAKFMRVAALFCAMAAGAAPAHAQLSPSGQGDARFAAFHDACALPGLLEELVPHVTALGWRPITGAEDAQVAALDRLAERGRQSLGLEALRTQAFARDDGAMPLRLYLTQTTRPEFMVVGCGVYDFAARESASPQDMQAWIGLAPQTAITEAFTRYEWREPATLPGAFSIKLNRIQPGSEPARAFGFAGVSMTVEWAVLP